jgi:hypothetical protein
MPVADHDALTEQSVGPQPVLQAQWSNVLAR